MQENQNQKKNFFFGLLTGVAVMAVIGFFVMFGLYFNQQNKNTASRGIDQPQAGVNKPNTPDNKNIQL